MITFYVEGIGLLQFILHVFCRFLITTGITHYMKKKKKRHYMSDQLCQSTRTTVTHQFRGRKIYMITVLSIQADPFASELSHCSTSLFVLFIHQQELHQRFTRHHSYVIDGLEYAFQDYFLSWIAHFITITSYAQSLFILKYWITSVMCSNTGLPRYIWSIFDNNTDISIYPCSLRHNSMQVSSTRYCCGLVSGALNVFISVPYLLLFYLWQQQQSPVHCQPARPDLLQMFCHDQYKRVGSSQGNDYMVCLIWPIVQHSFLEVRLSTFLE